MPRAAKRIASEVLLFLEKQRLNATPPNYALGYCFVTAPRTPPSREISDTLNLGMRLTQEAADGIISRHGLGRGGVIPAQSCAATLGEQMLRLAEIASKQGIATSRFGRELRASMASIGEEMMNFGPIVSVMIELAAGAERDLAATAAETERLRQDLDAVQRDANVDAVTQLPSQGGIVFSGHAKHRCTRDGLEAPVCSGASLSASALR